MRKGVFPQSLLLLSELKYLKGGTGGSPVHCGKGWHIY